VAYVLSGKFPLLCSGRCQLRPVFHRPGNCGLAAGSSGVVVIAGRGRADFKIAGVDPLHTYNGLGNRENLLVVKLVDNAAPTPVLNKKIFLPSVKHLWVQPPGILNHEIQEKHKKCVSTNSLPNVDLCCPKPGQVYRVEGGNS
jgi:hypothetical protein